MDKQTKKVLNVLAKERVADISTNFTSYLYVTYAVEAFYVYPGGCCGCNGDPQYA